MGGGIDAAVATFSAGVTKPGQHVAMIGTSMCWGYVAKSTDAGNRLIGYPYVVGTADDLYVFGGAGTAGAAVSWFRDQFCQSEIAAGRDRGIDAYRLLDAAAAAIEPGADGIVFLPYLMGERSPVWDSRVSGAFVGLNLFHTRAHLYRAVLEGVTFALCHNMEAGAKGSAKLDPRLIVVGGAAKSDLWMQIIADVTGYPVWTIREDVEAAIGAARLAALGCGLATQNATGWSTLIERALPDPVAQAGYDRMYATYAELYPALAKSMNDLSKLRAIA